MLIKGPHMTTSREKLTMCTLTSWEHFHRLSTFTLSQHISTHNKLKRCNNMPKCVQLFKWCYAKSVRKGNHLTILVSGGMCHSSTCCISFDKSIFHVLLWMKIYVKNQSPFVYHFDRCFCIFYYRWDDVILKFILVGMFFCFQFPS